MIAKTGTAQGDRPVDIDVKVAFLYKNLTLKRNFQIKSTGGFGQTLVTLYAATVTNTAVTLTAILCTKIVNEYCTQLSPSRRRRGRSP